LKKIISESWSDEDVALLKKKISNLETENQELKNEIEQFYSDYKSRAELEEENAKLKAIIDSYENNRAEDIK